MDRNLPRMAETAFDVLIIGGGIIGAGIMRDAVLRGFKVGLVEKEDFGAGTTARSTRLIHGGLRYLEQFDFRLVRESLREREILLHIAPHLVHPLPFLTPVYQEDRYHPFIVRLGMFLYDLLSYDKSLPHHRHLSREEVLAHEPLLRSESLCTGFLYYDGQCEYPERLCLENVLAAVEQGGEAANHAEVCGFLQQNGRVTGIRVRDRLNGEEYDIRARLIVSAVGPWADQVERMLNPQAPRRLRTTKGIHLLTPKFVNHAVVMLARRDGRVFFAIPWEGYTLIGTTDTDYTGDLDRIPTTVGDVEYLVEEIRYHFPSLSLTEIYTTTAGVRPLVPRREGGSPSDTSRRHRLFDHRQEGIEGVLSVLGGKITDYRLIAEQTVDVIEARLGRKHVPCQTASTPLIGGQMEDFQEFLAREVEQGQKQGVDPFCLEHLIRTYGSRYPEVLKLGQQDPTLLEPITPSTPSILAQVVYGVQHEMVRTSADLLIRRLGLILHPGEGLEALDRISPLLGKLLHWTPEQQEQDRQAYLDEVTLRHVS